MATLKMQGTIVILSALVSMVTCEPAGETAQEARRLYDTLLSGYSAPIRPVRNNSDIITVRVALRLSQLLGVDLKKQTVTTSVWLRHEWYDIGLTWNPKDYGNIKTMNIPAEEIWLPDIVLYNNADGNYEGLLMTKATVHYNGRIQWDPPVTFQSLCDINVELYPFDQQICEIKLGSWTYPGHQLDLKHFLQDPLNIADEETIHCALEFRDYYQSAEWDILNATAVKSNKPEPRDENDHPKVTFRIRIRRKALFYIINIIIPCISISCLAGLVFYLPSESAEKISMCITILLSLNIFVTMLVEKIPPTALVIPLLGKYLLFSMILITFSVILTVIVLNIHHRTPLTHNFPDWAKFLFLEILPKILVMRKPEDHQNLLLSQPSIKHTKCPCGAPLIEEPKHTGKRGRKLGPRPSVEITFENIYGKERARRHYRKVPQTIAEEYTDETGVQDRSLFSVIQQRPAFTQAIDGVRYIAKKLRESDENNRLCEEWKYLAIVLDRLFLWVYTVVCVVGTCIIMLKAPLVYYWDEPIVADGHHCDPWMAIHGYTRPPTSTMSSHPGL